MSFPFRRSIAVLGAALGLALVAPLVVASPASAHDELLASSPTTNEALDSAPEQVVLTFSDEVLTIGATVLVVGDGDTDWVTGDAVLNGTIVTTSIDPDMPDGAYEVRWRVVSGDGHPLTGVIPFTVGDVAPAPAEEPSADAGTGRAEASAPAADTATVGSTADEASGEIPRTVLIALGGAAVAVLIWLIFLAWRRRRPRITTSPAIDAMPDDTEHSKGSR